MVVSAMSDDDGSEEGDKREKGRVSTDAVGGKMLDDGYSGKSIESEEIKMDDGTCDQEGVVNRSSSGDSLNERPDLVWLEDEVGDKWSIVNEDDPWKSDDEEVDEEVETVVEVQVWSFNMEDDSCGEIALESSTTPDNESDAEVVDEISIGEIDVEGADEREAEARELMIDGVGLTKVNSSSGSGDLESSDSVFEV